MVFSAIASTGYAVPTTTDGDRARAGAATPASLRAAANLQITKSVSPEPLVIGGSAVYTLTVTNNGDEDATGVTVTDQLGQGLSVGELPDSCVAQGLQITCGGTGITVPAGGTREFQVPVTVDPSLSDGTNITNQAAVQQEGSSQPADSTTLISQSTTLTDVEITKTATPEVEADGTYTFTVTVTNHGPSDAVDVTVQDPTNGQLSSIEERPEECPDTGLTLSCPLNTLSPGETRTFTVTMRANPDAAGQTIPNCAEVYTGSRETNTENNRSCASTDVIPPVTPSPSPTTDEPTPSPTTDEPTPSPTTDEPTPSPTTDEPTPSPTTDEPTPSPTTDEPTPSPTTDEPTPSPTTDEPTPTPTTPEPTSTSTTPEPTPTPTPTTQEPTPSPSSSGGSESPAPTSSPTSSTSPTSPPDELAESGQGSTLQLVMGVAAVVLVGLGVLVRRAIRRR
ncbi:CARDB domain-containing protein [Streptomyces sp. NPDC050439]|uniref:CARDB domain-containing protein n=1 Tax=unclassified Streptomyces TaxID=2593676 RepID=UPI00342B42D2